ncbi:MAG: penicillin-binding protein 1C [Bdellovibrionales bacterium]
MKHQRRLLPIAIFTLAAVSAAAFVFWGSPQPKMFKAVQRAYRSSELVLLDRDGLVLHEARQLSTVRRLPWTSLDHVPYALQKMILRAEDKRFYNHFGVDVFAFAKVALISLTGRHYRGASTISMQLVELLQRGGKGGQRRSLAQKLKQMHAAIGLEQRWSKSQIFEAYLNLLYFRGELQGIAAAAQGIFGKDPLALTDWESAVVTSLIRAPNASADKVLSRTCWIMADISSPCQPPEALAKSLSSSYWIKPLERLAPHLMRHLPKERLEGRVVTTLKRELQVKVRDILNEQVSRLREQNLTDASAVVLDNATGDVLAYVGNIGEKSASPHVDAAFAQRQAGSTLKPFIYGLALQKKLITAASVLPDTPTDVAVSTGLYRPANYDRRFRNNVSARVALASSLNIPAVKVLEAVTVEKAVELLNELGFTGLQRADFYGPSVALGSVDVRLLELSNAYRSLANEGRWSPLRFLQDDSIQAESRQALSPEAAFIVSDMIADRGSRGATFGWENALATRYWTAVKTGTSKDMRDNWCVGYSKRYTVGVWAGNLTGAAMWNVSGVQGAAPAWMEIMNFLHQRETSIAPTRPLGVSTKKVRFSDSNQTIEEWFINGTEPPGETIRVMRQAQSRLLYPVDQTMVALDPDIPLKQQKIYFTVNEPEAHQVLRLNGRRLAKAQTEVGWTPYPGRFKLELVDRQGKALDVVHFQVRGRER